HGAEPQLQIETAINRGTVFELTTPIVVDQFGAFAFGKIYIRIIKERRDIVFGEARAHTLEIDQVRLTVSDNDVLGLKIAVYQDSREGCQAIRDFLQGRQGRQLRELCLLDFE